MRGIIIYSPVFCRNSAGVYALYRLAHDLKDRGVMALTTIWNSNYVLPPVMGIPIVPNIVAKSLISEYMFSALYPEVISGNPLQAKNVIRWVMNRPGLLGGDETYDPSETVLTYGAQYDGYVKGRIAGHLTLPTIDEELFSYEPLVPKTDITVYTGKREFKPGFIDRYDNLVTRTSPSHEKVAEIFKKTKTLYSFDCVSSIINEARFAGCNVVLIDDGFLPEGGYQSEFGTFGVSMYGKHHELESPDAICDAVRRKLAVLRGSYSEQLDSLIGMLN